MEKLLADTQLTFAVYNGDMPQCIPEPTDSSYNKVMRKVDSIRGITRDEDGNIIQGHLYSDILFLADNDSAENYIEVEKPVEE